MTTFIAYYNGKKIEVQSNKGIYQAKLKAIELLKIPKSRQSLLAIIKKDSQDFIYD